jgi:hypothetical protein
MSMQTAENRPISVTWALCKLGADMRDARRRLRIPTALLARRALISRMTLRRVEKGDGGTSAAAYASVLLALGMSDRLATFANLAHDAASASPHDEPLPQRVRLPKAAEPNAAEL